MSFANFICTLAQACSFDSYRYFISVTIGCTRLVHCDCKKQKCLNLCFPRLALNTWLEVNVYRVYCLTKEIKETC